MKLCNGLIKIFDLIEIDLIYFLIYYFVTSDWFINKFLPFFLSDRASSPILDDQSAEELNASNSISDSILVEPNLREPWKVMEDNYENIESKEHKNSPKTSVFLNSNADNMAEYIALEDKERTPQKEPSKYSMSSEKVVEFDAPITSFDSVNNGEVSMEQLMSLLSGEYDLITCN